MAAVARTPLVRATAGGLLPTALDVSEAPGALRLVILSAAIAAPLVCAAERGRGSAALCRGRGNRPSLAACVSPSARSILDAGGRARVVTTSAVVLPMPVCD